jgi:hypothetical protein
MDEVTKKQDGPSQMNDGEESTKIMDLSDMYKFGPDDLVLNISGTHYSNITYIQVAPREVVLDFLEMPGVKREGKMVVEGTRIYLSHVAALKLVVTLKRLLSDSYKEGRMEIFELPKQSDTKLTTKAKRLTREEQV